MPDVKSHSAFFLRISKTYCAFSGESLTFP